MTTHAYDCWADACDRWRTNWKQLVRQLQLNPSMDPEWIEAAISSHDLKAHTTVAVTIRDGHPIGFFPFISRIVWHHGLRVRVAEVATNVVSYHPEIASIDPPDSLIDFVFRTAHDGHWDVFLFNGVPTPSVSAEHILLAARRNGVRLRAVASEVSPYIAIDRPWSDFLTTRSKKFRANLQRSQRRSESAGATEMRWYRDGADTRDLLNQILQIEQNTWKQRQGTSINNRQSELRYHELLLPLLASWRTLYANVLMHGEIPVAYVLCCNRDGWVGQLKTSFDERFRDAGSYAIDESVRSAFEIGATSYDFLGDVAPHKTRWTSLARAHENLSLYANTMVGRALWALHSAKGAVKSLTKKAETSTFAETPPS